MIDAVELSNFKCFERASIALGSITLATGLNGSGKSSLIQSLLLLHQSQQQGLLRDGKLALNGELVQLGAGKDAFCEFADEEVMRLKLSWRDCAANWEFDYDRHWAARSITLLRSVSARGLPSPCRTIRSSTRDSSAIAASTLPTTSHTSVELACPSSGCITTRRPRSS